MDRKTRSLLVALLLLTLTSTGALSAAVVVKAQYFADECNTEQVRQQFIDDVAAGATEADLEFKYGGCREYLDPTNQCTASSAVRPGDIRSTGAAVKSVLNANIFYERLNGCGYHPQAEMVSCDVELRQPFGFGGFPGGTTEWVRFCLDCNQNGIWDYTTSGSVHVTNDISGAIPGYFFEAHATTFDAPGFCTVNNGGAGTLRAILSWVLKPATCSSRPFWGNTITETIRRDP
jgi:hypothetical protein